MTIEILTHMPVMVPISDIQTDGNNPNVMTESQMTALKESMKTYGFLTPIVVDQDNKLADGEHRYQVYKELGMTEIPAYRVNLKTDTDRRLLRQIMNKVKGTHDKVLDAQEFQRIIESGGKNQLTSFLSINDEQLGHLLKDGGIVNDELLKTMERSGNKITIIKETMPTEHTCPKCGYSY